MVGLRTAVALVCVVSVGGVGAARAGAAVPTHPAIVSVVAAPRLVARSGGSVLVRVRVDAARTCTFVGQRVAAGPYVTARTLPCASGVVSARLAVKANPYTTRSTIHFRVVAHDRSGHTTTRNVTVGQAAAVRAATPPAATSATTVTPASAIPLLVTTASVPDATVGTPYSAALTVSGGRAPYTWAVWAATLPSGLTLSRTTGAITGTPTSAGQSTFSVSATDASGDTATATLSLTVVAAAAAPPVATSDVTDYSSTNWSGYVAIGGPYTGVTGTFNVPTLHSGPVAASTSEWVGIDGTSDQNGSIVQAGVDGDYSPTTNTYSTYAWVELYPAPAEQIPLEVTPGNQITVSIVQSSPGIWLVQVKNLSTGQSWAEDEAYSGPATSAEWIVEAPSTSAGVLPLASYSPVTFTHLGLNPTAGDLGRIVMVQDGETVSTPSALSANGFTVDYGDVTPAGP